jgi:hypothetical protein
MPNGLSSANNADHVAILGLLGRRHVEHAVAKRRESRRVAIESSDPDLVTGIGHLRRLRGAKRESVGLGEDNGDVRMGLQEVGGQLETFVWRCQVNFRWQQVGRGRQLLGFGGGYEFPLRHRSHTMKVRG